MIASEILAKGVEQGIISAEQAERLRALEDVREPPELPASPDDEQLRFIGGFSDIFVTIGLAMFLGAIGYFSLQTGGKLGMWIAIAITAWLLAEFFTRLRRMALPSIVLLIVFAVAVFIGASIFLGAGISPYNYPLTQLGMFGINASEPTLLAIAALLTVFADCRSLLAVWRAHHDRGGCGALETGTVIEDWFMDWLRN